MAVIKCEGKIFFNTYKYKSVKKSHNLFLHGMLNTSNQFTDNQEHSFDKVIDLVFIYLYVLKTMGKIYHTSNIFITFPTLEFILFRK